MKYVKILGLAAIAAAALMAFVGAGTASATALCSTNTTPCTSVLGKGTKVESSLKAGTKAVLKAGFATVECSESVVNGEVENAGGASATVGGKIQTLSFPSSSCNCETKTLAPGELEIHWISGGMTGTVTAKGSEVTVNCFGTDCVYGPGASGMDVGEFTSSNDTGGTPVIHARAKMTRISGSFFCSSEAEWNATYEVSAPMTAYVSES